MAPAQMPVRKVPDVEPVNLIEYEELARQKLPQPAFDFIAGGAEDEVTLAANRAAFQRIPLRPRVLIDVSNVDLSTTVLGQPVDFPVLLAPVALVRLGGPPGGGGGGWGAGGG